MTENPSKKNPDQALLHVLKLVLVGILCFVVIVFVFGVGVFVGQKRAEFSFQWAQNYHRNFGGPTQGIFSNFPVQNFTSGHGVFGQIIGVGDNMIIVKAQDNREEMVMVSSQTSVVSTTKKVLLSNIKIGDNIVIIGEPDQQGRLEAKFIRILP